MNDDAATQRSTVAAPSARSGALARIAEQLNGGEALEVRMRGEALSPIVADGAIIELEPVGARPLRLGDIAVAAVDGRWVLRIAVVWGPQRGSVLLGDANGAIAGWAALHDVAGIVARVDGRAPRRRR